MTRRSLIDHVGSDRTTLAQELLEGQLLVARSSIDLGCVHGFSADRLGG